MKKIVKIIFSLVIIVLIMGALNNVVIFENRFIFVIPFVFFLFFINRYLGIFSLIFYFCLLVDKSALLGTLMISLILGTFVFIKRLMINYGKLQILISFCCFLAVFAISIAERYLLEGDFSLYTFISSVISYWVMYYYYELYFSYKGVNDKNLDSNVIAFVFVILGIIFLGAKLIVFERDFSFIILLFLCYIATGVGFDVGAVYSISMLGVMYLFSGWNENLIFICLTFFLAFFLRHVTRLMFGSVYLLSSFVLIKYFSLSYLNIIDHLIVLVFVFLFSSKFIKFISSICYGKEEYVKKICDRTKKHNLDLASKVVKMQEVFSLVCEKIDLKERLKKNDKRLLSEEIAVFSNLLETFSKEIKDNYNFEYKEKIEREFFRYNLDLVDFKLYENVLKHKFIEICVRCGKNEINNLIVPIVNNLLEEQFELSNIAYNDFFGYYKIFLKTKKNYCFKYGVSQKSYESKACGDSYLVYENKNVYAFALSDGMGTGKVARETSKLALDLFRKFMDIGFSLEQTLKSLNSILRGKYEKEVYSTLDLFVYDKVKEKFYFCKNGANDSYLLKENIEIIKGNKLPLGIVENLNFEIKEIEVGKNNIIIMVSDGVGENIENILIESKNKEVQKTSEFILKHSGEISDDKTVFVIKIC